MIIINIKLIANLALSLGLGLSLFNCSTAPSTVTFCNKLTDSFQGKPCWVLQKGKVYQKYNKDIVYSGSLYNDGSSRNDIEQNLLNLALGKYATREYGYDANVESSVFENTEVVVDGSEEENVKKVQRVVNNITLTSPKGKNVVAGYVYRSYYDNVLEKLYVWVKQTN